MGPEPVPEWLKQVARRLGGSVTPHRNKALRVQSSATLSELGLMLMDRALREPFAKRQAICFRDGLMIALLAAVPVRLSNLATIRIGTNLARVEAEYPLHFSAAEMKQKRAYEGPFPPALTPGLDLYLARLRPLLLRGAGSDRLWISAKGQGIAASTIWDNLCRITERELGARVNPHLFRHCLATSVTINRPELIGIVPPILGHTGLATMTRYYNQAGSAEAMQRHQDNIIALRRNLSTGETF